MKKDKPYEKWMNLIKDVKAKRVKDEFPNFYGYMENSFGKRFSFSFVPIYHRILNSHLDIFSCYINLDQKIIGILTINYFDGKLYSKLADIETNVLRIDTPKKIVSLYYCKGKRIDKYKEIPFP